MKYIITQRTCLKCGEIKPLDKENFSYHSNHKCFTNKCLSCINEERRNEYPETKARRQSTIKLHPENRTCIKCNAEKNISYFSFKASENSYSYVCKYCDCQEKRFQWQRLTREEKKAKSNHKKTKYTAQNKLTDYKRADKKKGLECNIDKVFVSECLGNNCVYCDFPATTLDRLDNTKGHLIDNCVPCCLDCNLARGDRFTYEEMLEIGKAIAEVKQNRK